MTEELKTCPFCGGTPKVITQNIHSINVFCVYCKKCGVRNRFTPIKPEAVARWNSRYPLKDAIKDAILRFFVRHFWKGKHHD